MYIEKIDISQIQNLPLCPSRFNRDDRDLEASISSFGIFSPPCFKKTDAGYIIIDGSIRIGMAKRLGENFVLAQVYEAGELSDEDFFKLCVELNVWSRSLNLVEQSLLLERAHEIFGGMNIPKWFYQKVGIKKNIQSIHRHRDLLKLPHLILKYAVSNDIKLPIILGFLRFPKDHIEDIANQLFVLPMNQNKLGETLGLLLDISKREDVDAKDVLMQALSDARGMGSAIQKEQELRRVLHRRRNPRYEQRLLEFEEKVQQLGLKSGLEVQPAPYFADDGVHLSLKVNDLIGLKKLVKDLEVEQWERLLPETDL